ncbi:MAG: hypothetical protein U0R68_11225 [Candidatus Nanopelagicales bacterium]
MISIARGFFGAPDSVPAGKVDEDVVRGAALRQAADHGRDDVHDVAVALDLHELDDLDRAGRAHAAEVVALEAFRA